MVIGSAAYAISIESSDSPASVDDEEILSSFLSSFMRMARERSSANCATRWMAVLRSAPCTTTDLVFSRGSTAS